MPYGLFEAHWRQMPRIIAMESLHAFERGAVSGSVRLRDGEPQRTLRAWQKAAAGQRRRRRVSSQEDRISALQAMGVPVVIEGAPDG